MGKSYKRNPYHSCNAGSFKEWKQIWNQIHRHNCKIAINTCKDWDELILPTLDESSDIWDSPKDGRMRRVETPALNQCEIDEHQYITLEGSRKYRIKWYTRDKTGHHCLCDCYTNKRGRYWKMMRK